MAGHIWTRRSLIPAAAGLALASPVGRALGQVAPVPKPPAAPGAPEALAIGIDAADRMTVDVRVNGQGPFNFLIDTGAERSAISVELATKLGLPMGPDMVVHGVAGALSTGSAIVDDLGVGARHLTHVALPLLGQGNLGAVGVLGIDAVQNQRVVLDFHRDKIFVEATPARTDYDEVVVHARSRFGQLVLVDSFFAHRPVLVVIDTGAETTIGNLALKRLVTLEREAHPEQADIFSVTGQSTTGDWAIVPLVQVGGFGLRRLPVVFSDLHSFSRWKLGEEPALLLGMDVLRLFDAVEIDFGQRQVRFRGAHATALPPSNNASRLGWGTPG